MGMWQGSSDDKVRTGRYPLKRTTVKLQFPVFPETMDSFHTSYRVKGSPCVCLIFKNKIILFQETFKITIKFSRIQDKQACLNIYFILNILQSFV